MILADKVDSTEEKKVPEDESAIKRKPEIVVGDGDGDKVEASPEKKPKLDTETTEEKKSETVKDI